MPLEEPSWWYGAGPDGLRARLLAPLGEIAGRIAISRFRNAAGYCANIPVICIGNFTAGGTGKTPMSLAVVALLKELGETPVFLTRGYGGNKRGPVWLDPASDTAREAGDEPLLLARAAPVMIARDRKEGALAIESGTVPATVIVMDDGLQNPSLEKELTIAVVDGTRGLGNGHVIPAGPLRAPLEFQASLVDAVVVNGGGAAPEVLQTLKRHFPGPVMHARPEPVGDTAWITVAPLVAFAGIANPARFFALLERLGGRLAERVVFKDHHTFAEADAGRLLSLAKAHGAALVTTEKDWVRLSGQAGALAALKEAARTLPIRLTFDEAETSRLRSLLEGVLARSRNSATGNRTPAGEK